MANFEIAVTRLLPIEGGYKSGADGDPGGETKYGITKRTFPNEDIKNLTMERAIFLYRTHFWAPSHLEALADQRLANKLFDMIVNMGADRAIQCLQKAINYLTNRPQEIAVDGVLGPVTLSALRACNGQYLYLALEAYHAHWYIELVEGPDPRYEKFAPGWLVRALS